LGDYARQIILFDRHKDKLLCLTAICISTDDVRLETGTVWDIYCFAILYCLVDLWTMF